MSSFAILTEETESEIILITIPSITLVLNDAGAFTSYPFSLAALFISLLAKESCSPVEFTRMLTLFFQANTCCIPGAEKTKRDRIKNLVVFIIIIRWIET